MDRFFKSFTVSLIVIGLMHADTIRLDGDMSENIQNLKNKSGQKIFQRSFSFHDGRYYTT